MTRASRAGPRSLAGPLVVALAAHAVLVGLALRLVPRSLPTVPDPPGIALVEVAPVPTVANPPEPTREPEPTPPPTPILAPILAPAPEAVAQAAPAPPARSIPPRPAARPVAAPSFPAPPRGDAVPGTATADPHEVATWRAALSAWIDRNRRYPPAARFRQDEGVVEVRFTLDPAGRVVRVDVLSGSGSATLDAAALALFTGATLPAPPPNLDPALLVVSLPVRYRLQ